MSYDPEHFAQVIVDTMGDDETAVMWADAVRAIGSERDEALAEIRRLRRALQKVYDAGKPPEGRRWLGNESRIAAIAGEALGLPVTSGIPATPPNAR